MLISQARKKQIEIKTFIDFQTPVRFVGDPGRLRQILLNFASNAIKFTVEGTVTIRIQVKEQTATWAKLLFEVEDTGIGISQVHINQLFQSFSQGDSSTTRKYGGTGLGLAICKKLVAMMNGHIGVKSQEGVGSVFWFTLKLEKQDADNIGTISKRKTTSYVISEHRKQEARILVAEDHAINRKVAIHMLKKMGYVVDAVETGQEVLQAMGNKQYDLILMDVQMPEMEGNQASRAIREQEIKTQATRLPIIAMTANAMKGDREECLAAGMDDYIPKPVDPQLLKAKMKKWLG